MFSKPDFQPKTLPGYGIIIVVCALLFLLQTIFSFIPQTFHGGRDLITSLFILERPVWSDLDPTLAYRMFTYAFLHEGFFHLLFNMIVLLFAARPLEERIGRAGFLKLYFAAALFTGFVTTLHGLLIFWNPWSMVLGASGAVSAFLFIFWRLNPDAEVLLFFIIPLPIRYVMWGLIAIDGIGTFVPLGNHLSHVTHLAGYGFGWLFLRYGNRFSDALNAWQERRRTRLELHRYEREQAHRHFYENEIDPILKKIADQGMESLSDIERRILQKARKGRPS